jgi:hypothetical protein
MRWGAAPGAAPPGLAADGGYGLWNEGFNLRSAIKGSLSPQGELCPVRRRGGRTHERRHSTEQRTLPFVHLPLGAWPTRLTRRSSPALHL